MLARIAGVLKKVCDELVVVLRGDEDDALAIAATALQIRVVADSFADAGPMAGVEAGLASAGTDLSFVTGGDLPFLSQDLITAMAVAAEGHAAVTPRIGGSLQPLHAIYRRAWLPIMRDRLSRSRLSLRGMLGDAVASGTPPVRIFERAEIEATDPSFRSLFDIDTPEHLAEAERMARGMTRDGA